MMITFTSPKFLTRSCIAALVAAICLPAVAQANSGTTMMVGAVVLPPACVASTDTARVAVKCAGSYSFVTRMENDTAVGQSGASQMSTQRAAVSRVDLSNGGQRRLTVTY